MAAGKAKTEEAKRLSRLNQQKQRQKPDVVLQRYIINRGLQEYFHNGPAAKGISDCHKIFIPLRLLISNTFLLWRLEKAFMTAAPVPVSFVVPCLQPLNIP